MNLGFNASGSQGVAEIIATSVPDHVLVVNMVDGNGLRIGTTIDMLTQPWQLNSQ